MSLLKRLGYTLSKTEDEPREIVRAFAMEIEAVLQDVERETGKKLDGGTVSRLTLYDNLSQLKTSLANALFADSDSPELIRYAAAGLAAAGLAAALYFGELLPRPERA